MTKFVLYAALFSLLALLTPAQAQDDATAEEWQAIVTGQVEAFRAADGAAALSFAAASFQAGFTEPDQFVRAVRAWGYAPIMESRSHSFGPYRMVDPDHVLQNVTFVGADQLVYETVYRLEREAAGWRIGAVVMIKTSGMGA